jgi:Glutathione S-transferase, N-terminal domain
MALPYELKPVNVRKGEQKSDAYLTINPNGKVPVLVDSDGPGGKSITLSESGAIPPKETITASGTHPGARPGRLAAEMMSSQLFPALLRLSIVGPTGLP